MAAITTPNSTEPTKQASNADHSYTLTIYSDGVIVEAEHCSSINVCSLAETPQDNNLKTNRAMRRAKHKTNNKKII